MDKFKKLFDFVDNKRLRKSKSKVIKNGNLVINTESDKFRVINAAAFRRLQQKAQVFSLETNASVRTRLTHSIEVSQIGRYLAQEVISQIEKNSKEEIPYDKKQSFGNIIETACLLHDIGNPPFGHLGEAAIRNWFTKKDSNEYKELTHFDGNAQGFRLISYLAGTDARGLNLTASTMLTFVKYPVTNKTKGLFQADYRFSYKKACKKLNWHEGVKFPMAILMDFADEISYCMSDLEDGLEKGVITKYDLFKEFGKHKDFINFGITYPKPKKNDMYPYPFIMDFKTKIIEVCVQEVAKIFVKKLDDIVTGKVDNEYMENLKKDINSFHMLRQIKAFAQNKIYSNRKIELVELAGAKIISGLLDAYAPLLDIDENEFSYLIKKKKAKYSQGSKEKFLDFELRLINTIPHNYIKKYQWSLNYYKKHDNAENPTEKAIRAQLIVDFIAGMTDDFALEMYQFLEGIKIN